jgi:hypothetical protein
MRSPVAPRKPFLLRVDPALLDALQRWATDDHRSLNGHIEFLLRRDLHVTGRMPESRIADVPPFAPSALTDDDPPQADGWG